MNPKKEKWVVVTGGAGFIGSGVVRFLNNKGYQNVVIIDDLGKDEKWKNLVGKRFLDLISTQSFFSWLKGKESFIQAFIHLGACSDTTEKNADFLYENNFLFSKKLATFALENNHRFIYASSAATYGDGEQGFYDHYEKIHSLHPLNMYGYSKQLFDEWVLRENLIDQVVGLKYFNVFGPNETHKGRMASAICKLYPEVKRGEPLRLFKSSEPEKFGDGEQKRDFIYIKDAVKMTCAFLENEVSGIFNIGTGLAISWNRLGKALFKALGKEEKFEYVDMPEDLIGKYQNYTCADMTRAKKALGTFADCMSIEESVEDYVKNYLLVEKKW